MAKNYELVKKIAVLGGKEGGNTKEINIVRWGVFPPMIDIRRWKDGEPNKGITLNAEETKCHYEVLKIRFEMEEV